MSIVKYLWTNELMDDNYDQIWKKIDINEVILKNEDDETGTITFYSLVWNWNINNGLKNFDKTSLFWYNDWYLLANYCKSGECLSVAIKYFDKQAKVNSDVYNLDQISEIDYYCEKLNENDEIEIIGNENAKIWLFLFENHFYCIVTEDEIKKSKKLSKIQIKDLEKSKWKVKK